MRVIWSFEHAAWWGPEQRGYTGNLRFAGRYTLAEADEILARCQPGNEVHVSEGMAAAYQRWCEQFTEATR